MSEIQKSYVTDAIKDVKHHKSLLKILTNDLLENEQVTENLKSAVSHLEFAIAVLDAVARI